MRNFCKQISCVFFSLLLLLLSQPTLVYAAVSVTAATGGGSISADTTGGSYTTLTGPTLAEGASGDFPATGTLVLSAPTGFQFNTAQNVTATITRIAGSRTCFSFTSTTATPTSSAITFTLNAADQGGGNPATRCQVVLSNIQIRPSSGTPLASGNILHTGTASVTGLTGSSNLGTIAEVVGAKNKLGITTQPSSSATVATDFGTKPVVALQDQFGNTVTTDSTSTIAIAVVLSTQVCGGTAGSGTLSSTPASGTAFSSGVKTYTAMQYSVAQSIKLCFTSTGVTSIVSNTVSVTVPVPTVTTQAASTVKDATATLNGNITSTGGENNDKRGFVYDTSSQSLPGNVAPASSGYASSVESTGSFGTGAYTNGISGLTGGQTYYARAYSHNSGGYSYGSEVSFTTAIISITLTTGGTVSYGYIAANTSKDTTASGVNATQTVQNSSTIAEDFNIKTSDAIGGTQWTLGASSGSNTYVHEFSTNSGSNWTKFTTADAYQSLATNIATNGTKNFDLRITTPTSSSDLTQKTITITIQAVAN